MIFSKTEKLAYDLAAPVAESHGYEIYDVEYVKEGPHWFLRIFIDRSEGVNVDDCETVSREVGALLDEKDAIDVNYFLEISSPGIERSLRQDEHFEKAVGSRVKIKLYRPQDGIKEAVGELADFSDGNVVVNTDGGQVNIPKKNIAKANIVFDF